MLKTQFPYVDKWSSCMHN